MKPTEPPYEKLQINRTRPEPCDMEIDLYQLQYGNNRAFGKKAEEECARYIYSLYIFYIYIYFYYICLVHCILLSITCNLIIFFAISVAMVPKC
jgi:hypothetical protein